MLDFTVRVDRSRPTYPNWVKRVLHPELEGTGPAWYNLRFGVEQWLHTGQKSGVVRGQVIYDHLSSTNELAIHLGLVDLLAIQAKGITTFRALFRGKAVFAWKSVVGHRDGGLAVPYLCCDDGDEMLHWLWLDGYWGCWSPALRFRKK